MSWLYLHDTVALLKINKIHFSRTISTRQAVIMQTVVIRILLRKTFGVWKMWSFALRQHASNGSHVALSQHVFQEPPVLFSLRHCDEFLRIEYLSRLYNGAQVAQSAVAPSPQKKNSKIA